MSVLDQLVYLSLYPKLHISRCQNMEVPVDKIYNKTQREKFAWAIDMTEEDFLFWNHLNGQPHEPVARVHFRNPLIMCFWDWNTLGLFIAVIFFHTLCTSFGNHCRLGVWFVCFVRIPMNKSSCSKVDNVAFSISTRAKLSKAPILMDVRLWSSHKVQCSSSGKPVTKRCRLCQHAQTS